MKSVELQFINQINENENVIYRIIHSNCNDKNYIHDLFQDIVENAWKSYPKFEGRSKFSTWISSIAKFTAVDRIRRIKARATEISHDNIFFEIVDEPYYELPFPVIDTLTEKERCTLQLYMESGSYKYVSEQLNESINTITVRMHRIKKLFKKLKYEESI